MSESLSGLSPQEIALMREEEEARTVVKETLKPAQRLRQLVILQGKCMELISEVIGKLYEQFDDYMEESAEIKGWKTIVPKTERGNYERLSIAQLDELVRDAAKQARNLGLMVEQQQKIYAEMLDVVTKQTEPQQLKNIQNGRRKGKK